MKPFLLRRVPALVLAGLSSACLLHAQLANPPGAGDLQRLQGTWQGFGLNRETPGGPLVKSAAVITVTVSGNSFHFHRDTNFWFDTTLSLPAGTHPRQLHATIRTNAPSQGTDAIGKVVVALFKVEDGTLTLATRGDGVEDVPTGFDDEKAMRFELRKVAPRRKADEPAKSP